MSKNKISSGIWALILKLGTKFWSIWLKIGLAGLSFAGYAAVFSWKFALLILIAIGWHEQGHVWAMRKMKIKTKGWYMIPFFGGAAIAEEEYKTYGDNVYVAIMGPVCGAFLAWVSAGVYYYTHNPLWAAAAAWMAVVNIFNLLPVMPLDGGQIIRSIAFSIDRKLGLVFLIVSMMVGCLLMWGLKIGLFAILLIVGGLEVIFEIRNRIKHKKYLSGELPKWALPSSMLNGDGTLKSYPGAMNPTQLAMASAAYVLTLACLVVLIGLMDHIPGADLAALFLH